MPCGRVASQLADAGSGARWLFEIETSGISERSHRREEGLGVETAVEGREALVREFRNRASGSRSTWKWMMSNSSARRRSVSSMTRWLAVWSPGCRTAADPAGRRVQARPKSADPRSEESPGDRGRRAPRSEWIRHAPYRRRISGEPLQPEAQSARYAWDRPPDKKQNKTTRRRGDPTAANC